MTTPEERPGERATDPLALLFGVIVTIVGFNASDADIKKAAGVNLALIIGLVMLAMGVVFVVWLLMRPPEILHSHEMTEDELPEQLRHHGLEAIPEHPGEAPPPPPPPPSNRPPGGH